MSGPRRFGVIDGGKGHRGQFACPWCGATFDRRNITSDGVMSLEEHWQKSVTCGNNKGVNNQTQSKYLEPSTSEE